MNFRPHPGATPLRTRCLRNGVARSRGSEESGFAFLMALGMMLILLALSLVVLQNFVTDGKRTQEEETIWRGEQYERAIRLYYHKMGHYPQTLEDLQKGGLQLHFLRQAYKNPMNKTDGTWRFIYVNAAGQIIGSIRYATLQQMVLIDQYAGLLPAAVTLGPQTAQIGVPAASLASSSGSQQPQNPLAGILPGSGLSDYAAAIGAAQSQQQAQNSQPGSSGQSSDQSNGLLPPGITADQVNQAAQTGQLPAGMSADQVAQLIQQSGQLPAGISAAQVSQYIQSGQLPPGITPDLVAQYLQSLQNPQGALQSGQPSFGASPTGPSGSFSLGSASSAQPGLGGLGANPLLAMKPTGVVDGPVLGGFLTGVACTTKKKSVKVYRRGNKYEEWEFIWNPLEDALAAAQQGGGAPQGGVLGLGQTSSTPGSSFGGNNSNPFGNSSTSPGSSGSQQPPPQQPPMQPPPQ